MEDEHESALRVCVYHHRHIHYTRCSPPRPLPPRSAHSRPPVASLRQQPRVPLPLCWLYSSAQVPPFSGHWLLSSAHVPQFSGELCQLSRPRRHCSRGVLGPGGPLHHFLLFLLLHPRRPPPPPSRPPPSPPLPPQRQLLRHICKGSSAR